LSRRNQLSHRCPLGHRDRMTPIGDAAPILVTAGTDITVNDA